MDTQAAESNNRRLVSPNVINYLLYLKRELKDDQDTYNKFLQFILTVRYQRFHPEEILLGVKELLKDHQNMILGFKYLLEGREVAPLLYKDGVCFDNALDVIHEIQNCFSDDRRSFETFVNILKMCQAEEININEACQKMRALFKSPESQYLVDDLNKFLPIGRTSKQKERTLIEKHARKDQYGREDQDRSEIEQDETKSVHDTTNLDNLASKQKSTESNNSSANEQQQKESLHNEEHVRRSISPVDGSVENEMDKMENRDCREGANDSKKEEKDAADIFVSRDALYNAGYPRCTPSYCLLPQNYSSPTASCRTELAASVLNDILYCVTFGRREHHFRQVLKNNYEQKLFECEDGRYELDMLTELVADTSKKVKNLCRMLEKNKNMPEMQLQVLNHLTSSHLRCIEQLYDVHGLDFINILCKNPSSALPVLLVHLKRKEKELFRCRASLNEVWVEISAKYHLKSLDYRGPYFKQHDPKSFRPKALLAEIKEAHQKKRNKASPTPSNITGNRPSKTPDMEFEYIELDTHEDLYDIIKYACGQISTCKEQQDEIMGFWSTVIESMLGVSHALKGAESDCNNSTQKFGYDNPSSSEGGEKLRKVPKTNHDCASESSHARSVYQASVQKPVSCGCDKDDESAQKSTENILNLLKAANAELRSCKDFNNEDGIEVERMAGTQNSVGEGISSPSFYHSLHDKEEECSRVFYGNSSFYELCRLHQILYKRLLFAKTNSSKDKTKSSTMNDKSTTNLYARFKVSLYSLLSGSSSNSKYEDNCLAILGPQSYVLFTLDRLIDRVLRQLGKIMSSNKDHEFLQLHASMKSAKPGKSNDLGYYRDAHALLPNEDIFRFESFGNPTRLSIELMKYEPEETEGAGMPMDEDV